jgi:hypothetical protein
MCLPPLAGSSGQPARKRFVMTALLATDAARYAALFVAVQQQDDVIDEAVRESIDRAIGEFGVTGCAERVAQEFGDHPDTAAARMRWVRAVIEGTFTTRAQP